MSYISIHSPVGDLTLFEEDEAITVAEWGRVPSPQPTPLLEEAKRQLNAYFDGTLTKFDLPLRPAGSTFQKKVCEVMSQIPYGELMTYGQISKLLGSAPRAVGGACGRNPIPIIIPCHRVTGAKGKLTGFSGGAGISTKEFLLNLEIKKLL